ncbi:MAG: hypothetical protein L3J91_00245 [Thermoplasmata archaeon]|nr:hypothetical protein [Thermoplasmata archaeon]
MIEVRFHARGGQGGVVAAELLAQAAFLDGRIPQSFPFFGVQRSGATPLGACTTTTPVTGSVRAKTEPKKDIIGIALAHRPTYAATVNPSFPEDLVRKVERAWSLDGPRFVYVLAACPPGWRSSSEETIAIGRLATDTGLFPLYEFENGRSRVTRRLSPLKPVAKYVTVQGRSGSLTPVEIAELQERLRADWQRLLARESAPLPVRAAVPTSG